MIARAELLLYCFGKAQEALTILRRAGWERDSDTTATLSLGMAQAEALIALGQIEEAQEILTKLTADRGDTDFRRQGVKHAGLVRHASQLAGDSQDPAQLDHAMAMVKTVLGENPAMLLSPRLNVVRLDVHLGRGEYAIARYLAERLARLDMTAYDRAQVLVRHVKALCGAGDGAAARSVYEQLAQLSPQSSEVLEARNAMMRAAPATGAE